MVSPYVLPVPFVLTALVALLAAKERARLVGYVGSIAGVVTLLLAGSLWSPLTRASSVGWFSIATLSVSWGYLLDPLSLILVMLVAGIGSVVFLYSVGYLEAHESHRRYYATLALFAAAMISAVIAADLVQLIFSWELVGVSSYLLIGFWHHKETAVAAARKAFLTIIVGDAFLLSGAVLLAVHYKTLFIPDILSSLQADTITLLAGIGIIGGAISKSAQFPLHSWLPDAMAGPTPVSAFLHSATMVKAGLFLIARFLPLLVLVNLSPWIVVIAVVTIILSAASALVETDIKRVLAYSTMNHLAFILLAFGLGAIGAGLLHLIAHSIVKALLFFSAGILIHAADTQDLRVMRTKRTWSALAILTAIGAASLAGIAPLVGFFSKDAVYEAVLGTNNLALILLFSLAIIASAAYIMRWYLLAFKPQGELAHANWQMFSPLPILGLLALVGGGVYVWLSGAVHVGEAAMLSTIFALVGALLAYLVVERNWLPTLTTSALAQACREGFLWDAVSLAFARAVAGIGSFFALFDDMVVNTIVRGTGSFFLAVSRGLRKLHTGASATYLAAIVLGFIVLILTLGWWS